MEHAAGHADAAGISAGISTLLPLLVLVTIQLAYVAAVAAQGQRAARWSGWRTVSFTAGIGLLLVALMPPVADMAHNSLRGHMIQHLLIGMFAPLGLVLGAPMTLLLRTMPVRVARRIVALLGLPLLRWLMHPVTGAVLTVGGMCLLYLTPLYAMTLADPRLHALVHVHFLLSGYLFTWSIVGPDPAPHRPSLWVRLIVLFIAMAAHAMLGKIMYGYGFPRGTPYDLVEIQSAAQLMYYGGDLAEILLAVAFFAAWFRLRSGRIFREKRTGSLPQNTV